MIRLGITGGLGSGKSTVCKVFALLGVPVYNSDEASKMLLDHDPAVRSAILEAFGQELQNEGRIDRKKLASIVFGNKENLATLNSITHPAVGKHFASWLDLHRQQSYIIKEAAILFESGAYAQVDKVLTVTAPLDLRIERVVRRGGISREEALLRAGNQMADEEKISRSQYVIVNDEQELVIPQVLKIHEELK